MIVYTGRFFLLPEMLLSTSLSLSRSDARPGTAPRMGRSGIVDLFDARARARGEI